MLIVSSSKCGILACIPVRAPATPASVGLQQVLAYEVWTRTWFQKHVLINFQQNCLLQRSKVRTPLAYVVDHLAK